MYTLKTTSAVTAQAARPATAKAAACGPIRTERDARSSAANPSLHMSARPLPCRGGGYPRATGVEGPTPSSWPLLERQDPGLDGEALEPFLRGARRLDVGGRQAEGEGGRGRRPSVGARIRPTGARVAPAHG